MTSFPKDNRQRTSLRSWISVRDDLNLIESRCYSGSCELIMTRHAAMAASQESGICVADDAMYWCYMLCLSYGLDRPSSGNQSGTHFNEGERRHFWLIHVQIGPSAFNACRTTLPTTHSLGFRCSQIPVSRSFQFPSLDAATPLLSPELSRAAPVPVLG